MIQTTKWNTIKEFLERHLQNGTQYRAGTLYEAYLDHSGIADYISRKDFEMFLRDQVMKDNGMLKRVSHGVYEIRTEPNDRGVLFTRTKALADVPDDLSVLCNPSEQAESSIYEVLDESIELTAKIKGLLDRLNKVDGIPFPEQMELNRLQSSLLSSMDSAITGITAVAAWCEDNIENQEETESITMEGI